LVASPTSVDVDHSSVHPILRVPIVSLMAWFVAGLVVALLFAVGSPANDERAALGYSILSIGLGVWLFWVHGGSRITAVGVWGFAFALFVGVAGVFSLKALAQPPPGMRAALTFAYFGQVIMSRSCWRSRVRPEASRRWPIDRRVARWGIVTGSVLLVGSSLLSSGAQEEVVLVDATAFASAALLAASLLLHHGSGLGVWRLALAAGAFLMYAFFVFSGFGRLTLGALGLAIGIVSTKWFRGRVIKAAILVLSAPTLVILSVTRVAFTASLNPDQGAITGFESVTSPLMVFARLLEMHARLPRAWGSTFWAAAVALVPHGIWPNKPPGFGAVLVPILDPRLVGTGHSEAALAHGEWLYNFGLVGLVLMIPVLSVIVRAIDAWLEAVNSRPILDHRRLLAFVGASIAAAGLVDLVWVGTFTWVARSGSRLLVIGALAILSSLTASARAPSPRVHGPPPTALLDG
jgi:hypothetical protein